VPDFTGRTDQLRSLDALLNADGFLESIEYQMSRRGQVYVFYQQVEPKRLPTDTP
jgi:hypothetical protein